MSLPILEPITDERLLDYCRFLQENLYRDRTPESWAESFRQNWGVESPNHGFMLTKEGEIVGGIGAIYAERIIRGLPERFCNITSWCVLDAYRAQSMRLAMAVTSQAGYHFSDLTPTEVVSKTLQFLKFKPMKESHAVWPNFPWPFAGFGSVRIETNLDAIESLLSEDDARAFRDHRHFPWLNHLAIGTPGAFCHIVFNTTELKHLPGAFIIACSNPEIMLRHRLALGNHLLLKHGLVFSRMETRLLPELPRPCIELKGYRNKVYLSQTLNESDVSNLYSEIVALEP